MENLEKLINQLISDNKELLLKIETLKQRITFLENTPKQIINNHYHNIPVYPNNIPTINPFGDFPTTIMYHNNKNCIN